MKSLSKTFTFFRHVLIAEHEDDLLVLQTEFVVENLQVFAEVRLAVATAEFDLEHFAARSVRGQTRH